MRVNIACLRGYARPHRKESAFIEIRAIYAGILVSAYDIHRSRKGTLAFSRRVHRIKVSKEFFR